jgi:hypothetical protein
MERETNPTTRINIDAKLSLNQKNYILRSKRKSNVEIDELKENIRPKICNDTDDHTKGMNGNTMVRTDKQHRNRDKERKNTGLSKIESKH